MDLDNFHDQVSTEIDRRKLQKLIDGGKVTEEQMRMAPIIDATGIDGKIQRVECGMCDYACDDLSQFEEHLAIVHLGLEKTD